MGRRWTWFDPLCIVVGQHVFQLYEIVLFRGEDQGIGKGRGRLSNQCSNCDGDPATSDADDQTSQTFYAIPTSAGYGRFRLPRYVLYLQLLDLGYRVRCTVRSLTREPEVRRTLEQMRASSIGASLSFIEADLSADPGWDDADAGSSYVLHVASPFAVGQKGGNIDTIGIARSGTLRVLRAAHEAKVKRLVITSSFVALSYARDMDTAEFTEADWSDLSIPTLTAYVRSKTLAEKDAWD